MADDGSAQSAATWPLVKFSFRVKIGDTVILFQEVTGLDVQTQVIEYRAGNSKQFSTVKMPGMKKYGNITLKKGIFKDDKVLWDMYKKVTMNTFERKKVTISLLDEANNEAMNWELTNAFPVKMTVTDMKSDNDNPAIETMELAHEGLSIVK